eukprot:6029628-Amphidinium_carterae.1
MTFLDGTSPVGSATWLCMVCHSCIGGAIGDTLVLSWGQSSTMTMFDSARSFQRVQKERRA